MKDLIERSYSSIRKRGLITSDTEFYDFILKMEEECKEVRRSYCHEPIDKFENTIAETVDLMAVCINALVHHGFDPIAEFKKCVEYQEQRKD